MHDIFISYAKEDKLQAQEIAKLLTRKGFDVWWDEEILAGLSFDSEIEKAIETSKCVIVLWSKSSIKSEWVKIEAAEGKKRNILIPVRIEEVEIPLAFRRRHYIDLINWSHQMSDPNFQRLLKDIQLIIGNKNPENFHKDEPVSKLKSVSKSLFNKQLLLKYSVVMVVAILLIWILDFNLFSKSRSNEKYQLTVFVTDIDGNVVLEHNGELNTSIGNRPMHETIGEDGRTNFGDILPDYLGDSITIGFKSEGWQLANNKNTFVFDGTPIHIKIKKDSSLGLIKGVVKSRDGQVFIQNAQVLINSDTIISTDSNGLFNVTLPTEMRVEKATDGYMLTISKDGFETTSQYYYPKSSNAEIRLNKTK